MSTEATPTDDDRRPDSPARRVDAACDRFEVAWRGGQDPRIEDFLGLATEAERSPLLRELITLEVELRRGRGTTPAPGEYRDRFPGHVAVVDAAFAETASSPGASRRRPSSAREDTGRNLLLGLLALQNNFIGRDDLLAAFAAWVADRSRSLGQVLLKRGALSPGRQMLLEALVEEHIRLHDSDPRKSLAALSSIGSVRDDLSRVAAPDVQDSLARVSAARTDRDDDPRRTAYRPSVGDSTSTGTRFRILRPHAKGGLGEVFVALDTELNRDVALKEIQAHVAGDPRYRARFEFEAEVTGSLEHPGIVPVYGLGHTPDGRPFYAMRFIKGNSLKEAIRRFHEAEKRSDRDHGRGALELRDLLGRFIDVCDAVAYAHSRRVLHRDLKPGNIMLGKYGETLVVDWGLAKALDEPESPVERSELPLRPPSGSQLEPTLMSSAIGTPAYMSPEQVDGKVGKLGVRSDVYCLGATLYHLLAGHAPCEAEQVGEVYRKILAGDIPRPSSHNPRLVPALEAICLKALSLAPEDRYESAELMKADLERWLADEPVMAWREPFSTRARRWMRRHRSLVTAATVSVLVGLGALGIAYLRESATNRRLQLINAELAESNARVTAANAKSDRRLDQTLRAIEDYYTGVGEEVLLGQKEFRPLRERLLEKPTRFYEQLAEELESANSPDERTKGLLAKGRYGLGQIFYTLGKFDEAKAEYDAARTLYRELDSSHPDRPEYQNGLAWCHNKLGNVQRATGQMGGAAESYKLAVSAFERLAAARPKDPEYRNGWSGNCYNLAYIKAELGDLQGAVEFHRQAIAIGTKLAAEWPDIPEYEEAEAMFHGAYGYCLAQAGDLPGAADSYRRSIAIATKLITKHPNVLKYQLNLSWVLINQGFLKLSTGDPRTAAESHRQASAIDAKLATAQPNVPQYQNDWSATYHNLGMAQAAHGDAKGAEESFRRAIAIRTKLTETYPSVQFYQNRLAYSYSNLAMIRRDAGDRAGVDFGRRAIAIWSKLVSAQPDVGDNRHGLAMAYRILGDLQRDAGDRPGAAESLRRAIAIYAPLASTQPDVPEYQDGLARSFTRLGDVERERGELEKAFEFTEKSVSIFNKLVDTYPHDPSYVSELGAAIDSLGRNLMARAHHVEAERAFRRAIDRQHVAIAKGPDMVEFRLNRGSHFIGLIRALRAQGRSDEAALVARQNRAMCQDDPIEHYNAARGLALCVPIIGDDGGSRALAVEAVEALHAAIAAGWTDAARTGSDPDLASLHDRDDFRRLLAELFDRVFPAAPFDVDRIDASRPHRLDPLPAR